MLMLVAAVLVWANPVMGDEALPAEDASDVKADAKSAPCKGLKPYNNLDELLYQFYINLDSDCLFEMPISELEKIWDIKILSKERARGEEYSKLRRGKEFEMKSYFSEKDSFYVEIAEEIIADYGVKREFTLIATTEYYKKYGSLFPDEKFPKLLPLPSSSSIPPGSWQIPVDKNAPRVKPKGDYRDGTNYYWRNSFKPPTHSISINVYWRDVHSISIW
ncbi:hypothetical protein LJB99_06365 [Deltaproteobacteria bacterium OttesenSCG-928-K17]|nr:hypothetical protein [Deltaproteobacteria bacterium OttesenSCG-928-K17]